jgi:phage shock protein A
MGVFSRLSDIVNSNLNALLDRAEDPQKIVRLIIQEMEDTLVETRTAAARSIADRKELMRRVGELDTAVADWQRRAELAVSRGRDDLAKAALGARRQTGDTVALLRREIAVIDERLAKTDADLAKLQAKLTEAKNKQKAFEIRHVTVRDQIRIRTQLHDGRLDDALARYAHLERRLDQMEARAESFDLGEARGLDKEFATLEGEGRIEQELAELKARLGRA